MVQDMLEVIDKAKDEHEKYNGKLEEEDLEPRDFIDEYLK